VVKTMPASSRLVSSRIEIVDPNADKVIARITVPGEVTHRQITKEVRIGVTVVVDLGDKKKKKTFTVNILDDELKKRLDEYIDSLVVRIYRVETEDQLVGEVKMGEVKTV
jgi:hypothetical protein